jgi:DNA-binding LytR/AlgR family response regulator
MKRIEKVLVHIGDSVRKPIDPADVYYLEAVGDVTLIRIRSARPLHDVRSLGELLPAFTPYGFHRIHRNHAVNLDRIREIRRRKKGSDWELKLEPPVNRVLPISRNTLKKLLGSYGR